MKKELVISEGIRPQKGASKESFMEELVISEGIRLAACSLAMFLAPAGVKQIACRVSVTVVCRQARCQAFDTITVVCRRARCQAFDTSKQQTLQNSSLVQASSRRAAKFIIKQKQQKRSPPGQQPPTTHRHAVNNKQPRCKQQAVAYLLQRQPALNAHSATMSKLISQQRPFASGTFRGMPVE